MEVVKKKKSCESFLSYCGNEQVGLEEKSETFAPMEHFCCSDFLGRRMEVASASVP